MLTSNVSVVSRQPVALSLRFGAKQLPPDSSDDLLIKHSVPLNYQAVVEKLHAKANQAELADIYDTLLTPDWKLVKVKKDNKSEEHVVSEIKSQIIQRTIHSKPVEFNRTTLKTIDGEILAFEVIHNASDSPQALQNIDNPVALSGIKAFGMLCAGQAQKVAELEAQKDHDDIQAKEIETSLALMHYENTKNKKGLLPTLARTLASTDIIKKWGLLAGYRPPETQKTEEELPWVPLEDLFKGAVSGKARQDQKKIMEALLHQLAQRGVVRLYYNCNTLPGEIKYLLNDKGHLLFKQFETEIKQALEID